MTESQSRGNNFGLLRLMLASMVIISHSAELIDGNRAREILYRATGTMTLGGLAVDGFFIVSGYLITKSFINQNDIWNYTLKRISRIIPGYIFCFCVCAFVIAPLSGAGRSPFHPGELLRLSAEALRLLAPDVPGTFVGLPYPTLNGSMWTIAYEMRCYIATIAIGAAGLYGSRGRYFYLFFLSIALAIVASSALNDIPWYGQPVLGRLDYNIKLMSIFGCGALFFLFKDNISYSSPYALIAALLLCVCLKGPLAEPGVAVFGGYLIFWFALNCRVFKLSYTANKTDVSYGVYLYAFPIQNLIIYNSGLSNPWLLTLVSLPLAMIAGFLSWRIIERPALRFARHWMRHQASTKQHSLLNNVTS